MSGAQAVSGDREFFDLGPYRVEVFRADGSHHLRIVAGPFAPDGRLVTVANFMPNGATAAQFRAIAVCLDGVVA